MPKKKRTQERIKTDPMKNAFIEGAGEVVEERITETLEKNYMPYAMSVIVSRAFPEIDGFKPSHRKLLYTMYKMGLLSGARTKSANVVGQTMRLNPHGDQAIYETMVRMSRGNGALLHPYVDSKGNFGKSYSRDMAFAASRYTEVKLEPICAELFSDIDKETVDFQPNYDNTMLEPTLLPASFPSILVNSNIGIGVSMASNVCSFNLKELCESTIMYMKNPSYNLLETLKGPDFSTGALMLYNEEELEKIYRTGKGSVKIRARYSYDKKDNVVEITEIPPTTTVEAIIEKIISLIKLGKIKEIQYIRDETDLNGLKIAIDLKRGIDPDKLMQKLYKTTPLMDTFSCNFNILVHGYPRVIGVYDILDEWIAFRKDCVKRRVAFDLKKKKDKLHLLKGLEKILLDIDKAIKIVRETEEELEVVPNLMIGFSIDEIQAEYVAEIKLRHLNREYILKRTKEISELVADIADMEAILESERRVKSIIIKELGDVSKKYGQPRKTELYFSGDEDETVDIQEVEDYKCTFFMSRSGYFKKITPQSLRMANTQKLKDGDVITQEIESSNKAELLFFTDNATVYKSKADDFPDTKASAMGDFVAAKLSFEQGENCKYMVETTDYSGYMIFVFENGKVAKVSLNAYKTKTNRKKLANAYGSKSKLVEAFHIKEDTFLMLKSTNERMIIFNTGMILPKATRDTIGVNALTLKGKNLLEKAFIIDEEKAQELGKYKVRNIPAAGSFAKDLEDPDQLTF